MNSVLVIIEKILYVYFAISVIYILIFSLASIPGKIFRYEKSRKKLGFLILIPAYKEDKVISATVDSLLDQQYDKEKYLICVISDGMKAETNESLREKGINVLEAPSPLGTKANALKFALYGADKVYEGYDYIVILDADNVVEQDFLDRINDAARGGAKAIQCHRRAKNLNTSVALLDAVSEEINNSVFRKGHVRLGLSSALIGSGMAFEFGLFSRNVSKLSTAGEDKELERLLLKEGIYIEYLDYVNVYDEKVQNEKSFYNQRRRWIASQVNILRTSVKDIPGAIFSGNIDLLDKILQWMMPPRVILLGFLVIASLAGLFFIPYYPFRWAILLLLLLLSFAAAIPDRFITVKNLKALFRLPLLFLLMILNFFRIKGAKDKFIHTKKG